jgi:Tol biopolymer transport system component
MVRAITLGLLFALAGAGDAKLAFEKGLVLEEASGKLEEAIVLFRKVASDDAAGESLQAQAQLHIGICYEKLARKEARAAYQTVLDKYPGQQEAVRSARERLARLSNAAKIATGTSVREVGRSSPPRPGKLAEPWDDTFFAVSGDGETFAYTDWQTGDLLVRNTASGKVKGLYGVEWTRSKEFFFLPTISRDQKRIAYVTEFFDETTDVIRLGIDSLWGGSRETVFESTDSFPMPLDWSPDGSKILVALESPDRSVALSQIDVKMRRLERLVTLNWDTPRHAEYSPDGRFIAYDSTKDGEHKIYLITSDGREERVLVDSSGEDDSPVWSPDGRVLLFRSSRSGAWDLLGLPIDKGKPSGDTFLVKGGIGEAAYLRGMTADGRLFYTELATGPEIVLVERSGNQLGTPRVLPTVKTRSNSSPSFAPDGKRLAYISGTFLNQNVGRPALRIAALDGTVVKEVDFAPGFRYIRRPLFSPDGSKIAVAATAPRREPVVLLLDAVAGRVLKTFTFDPGGYLILGGWVDARHLAVLVRTRDGRMEQIDVETGERTVTSLPGPHDGLSTRISPDGRWLLIRKFPPGEPGKQQIAVRRLADGSETVVLNGAIGSDVTWDHDSRHFLYRKMSGPTQLWRASIETGAEEVVWDNAPPYRLSAVSPDGRLLAFEKPGGDWRIWVVENFLPAKTTATAAR